MRRGLFLDRDGIINEDHGYVHRPDQFQFRHGIFELCRAAQARGMALVVVTNQAGIGRGYYTEADFNTLTHWMLAQFQAQGVTFTAVEFCPDHPVHGIGRYRQDSPRRKPRPGMILDAARRHDLAPGRSVMLGDRATDMLAGLAAGVGHCILLPADAAEAHAAPNGARVLGSDEGLHGVLPLLGEIGR